MSEPHRAPRKSGTGIGVMERIFGRTPPVRPRPVAAEWSPDAAIEARLARGAPWPEDMAPIPEPLRAAYLLAPATRDDVLDRLRRFGVACVPSAIGGPLLRRIVAEFERALAEPDRFGASVDRSEDSLNVRLLHDAMDASALPAIHAVFASRWMASICADYFAGEEHLFNYEIFVQETQATPTPPSGTLHLDRRQTLKFWIYPEAMPAECGPMRLVPGSHAENARAREAMIAEGRDVAAVSNVVDELPGGAVPLVGTEGTLMIFDTDASHGASPVASGRRRRILRAHSRRRSVHEWSARSV